MNWNIFESINFLQFKNVEKTAYISIALNTGDNKTSSQGEDGGIPFFLQFEIGF